MNKSESRVELLWNLRLSNCLTRQQKVLLSSRIGHRLSEEGLLVLASEKHRSQHRNREEVSGSFLKLIEAGLRSVKKRRPTKPTRASVELRIKKKKIRGEIKKSRGHRPES